MYNNKRAKADGIILAVLLFLPALNYYFAEALYSFGIKNPLVQLIYVIVYLTGAYTYVRNIAHSIKAVYVVSLLLLISMALTPEVMTAITGPKFLQSLLVTLLFIYLPIFITVSDKKFDFDSIVTQLYPFALCVDITCIITYCIEVANLSVLHEYMTMAYTGLPAILLTIFCSYSKKHFLGIGISTLAAFTILFGGCRGALLTLVIFVVLMLFLSKNQKSTKWGWWVLILVLLVLVLNAETIFSRINNLLSGFGYESRIFSLLESENGIKSEGRDAVYKKAFSLINVWGHGIYSDRVLLEHVADSTYCHNWALEFMVDYGFIIGVLLVILMLFMVFRMFRVRDRLSLMGKFMLYFTVSMLFVKYMLSGSYLASAEFALILGWLVNSRSTVNAQ